MMQQNVLEDHLNILYNIENFLNRPKQYSVFIEARTVKSNTDCKIRPSLGFQMVSFFETVGKKYIVLLKRSDWEKEVILELKEQQDGQKCRQK